MFSNPKCTVKNKAKFIELTASVDLEIVMLVLIQESWSTFSAVILVVVQYMFYPPVVFATVLDL